MATLILVRDTFIVWFVGPFQFLQQTWKLHRSGKIPVIRSNKGQGKVIQVGDFMVMRYL